MKTRLIIIYLTMLIFASCQNEQMETQNSNDDELKKIEDTYGVKLNYITEEEAEKLPYISFDALKEFLDKHSNLSSRSGEVSSYVGIAGWISSLNFRFYTSDVKLDFNLPYNFNITYDFTKKLGAEVNLNFLDAFAQYGKDVFKLVFLKEFNQYNPHLQMQNINGHFLIKFSSRINNKPVSFDIKFSVHTKFAMGKDMEPIKAPFSIHVTYTMEF